MLPEWEKELTVYFRCLVYIRSFRKFNEGGYRTENECKK